MYKAIVLAAGKGTRLQTEGISLPKVMREANGKPLLHYVLSNLDFLDPQDIVLVVGYHREDVLKVFGSYPHAVQEPQLGTGHAVAVASPVVEAVDMDLVDGDGKQQFTVEIRSLVDSICDKTGSVLSLFR